MPEKKAREYDDGLFLKEVYAAEDLAIRLIERGGAVNFHGSVLDLSNCRPMRFKPANLVIMQGMVDGLYAQHRAASTPLSPPKVTINKRAFKKANYKRWQHQIMFPGGQGAEWAWNQMILLHEVAHACSGIGHDERSSHGKQWRKTYAALVSQAVGPEAGLILMDALAL